MTRPISNSIGIFAVCYSFALWPVFLMSPIQMADFVYVALLLVAVVLPPLAAWKSSKLWLLTLIIPAALYIQQLLDHAV